MKGYKSRRSRQRRPKNVILIVCEGKETEMNYFRRFNSRGCGVRIKPIHRGCTDPKSIVVEAKKAIREYSIDFDNGDEVWCVFDLDHSTNEDLEVAVQDAESNNIGVALSNPCIELWYLVHFEMIHSQKTIAETEEKLKSHINGYTKSMDVYDLLKDKLDDAISRAKQMNEKHNEDDTKLFSRESNPSSQIFKLVESIKRKMTT